jgi:hypothetical protein
MHVLSNSNLNSVFLDVAEPDLIQETRLIYLASPETKQFDATGLIKLFSGTVS